MAALFVGALSASSLQATTLPQEEVAAATQATAEFVAINADELPQAVKDAIAANYEGQSINAASVKDEEGVKTYKVNLVDADGNGQDVLFNEKGETLAGE